MESGQGVLGGRYRLIELIGRGGMGEVFLAEDLVLGRSVAIKRIIPDAPGSDGAENAVRRLYREARSAARIRHRNVVTVYDVLADDGQTYIVMEYVAAPSLAAVLRQEGSISPERAALIGAQIAEALDAAHQLGIVHRDVKPANILVEADDQVKLADFGVARTADDVEITQKGNIVGSVAYMAPEIARGDGAGQAADVFSLGATLFAALEGHPPFVRQGESSTSIRVLTRLVTETAPPAEHAGPLAGPISQMLASTPGHRPSARQAQVALLTVATTPDPQSLPTPTAADLADRTQVRAGTDNHILPPVSPDTPPEDQAASTTATSETLIKIRPASPATAAALPPVGDTPNHPRPDDTVEADATVLGNRAQGGTPAPHAPFATVVTAPAPTPSRAPAAAPNRVGPHDTTQDAGAGVARRHVKLRRGPLGTVAAVAVALAIVAGWFGYRLLAEPHGTAAIAVGKNPGTPAVGPDGTLYVPNGGDGTVSVINGDQVTATITVGQGTDTPVVGPDGTVYVLNGGDGTVSVINGDEVTATITVGQDTYPPAVGPDGTLYVANFSNGTVSVIKSDKVTATITVGYHPLTPAVGPDGTVYVPNNGDDTVSVITGSKVSSTLNVGQMPGTPVVGPSGTVYVPNFLGDTVSVITGNKVTSTITVGQGPETPAVGPDGTLYVSNLTAGTVSVINDNKVTATIGVGHHPSTPAVGADGTVYVANGGDDTVSVINGNKVTTTITVGSGPVTPAVGADGTVYVPNNTGDTVSVLR